MQSNLLSKNLTNQLQDNQKIILSCPRLILHICLDCSKGQEQSDLRYCCGINCMLWFHKYSSLTQPLPEQSHREALRRRNNIQIGLSDSRQGENCFSQSNMLKAIFYTGKNPAQGCALLLPSHQLFLSLPPVLQTCFQYRVSFPQLDISSSARLP